MLTAEAETLADDHSPGGNLIVVASDAPIDVEALRGEVDDRVPGWQLLDGGDLAAWAGDAPGAVRRLRAGRSAAHDSLTRGQPARCWLTQVHSETPASVVGALRAV